jgi:ABC-type polysaccharide/polyol phosphate transport system ATPase subunit
MSMEEKAEVPESERNGEPIIKLENANFGWGFRVKQADELTAMEKAKKKVAVEEIDTPVLKNIDIQASSGELVVVIGTVGSGKTSLLQSLMRETTLQSGSMEVRGTIAYVE